MFSSFFPLKHNTKKSHQGGCSPLSSRHFCPLQLVSQLACLWPVLATLRFQSLAFSVTSSKGFLCAAPKSLQLIGRISNSFTMENPANKRLNARRSWEVAISIFKAHNFYCTSSCAWSPFTSNLTVYKCSSLNWITHPRKKKTSSLSPNLWQALNSRFSSQPFEHQPFTTAPLPLHFPQISSVGSSPHGWSDSKGAKKSATSGG